MIKVYFAKILNNKILAVSLTLFGAFLSLFVFGLMTAVLTLRCSTTYNCNLDTDIISTITMVLTFAAPIVILVLGFYFIFRAKNFK